MLAARLAGRGHRVGVFDAGKPGQRDRRSGSLRQLLRLEQKMSGGGRIWLCDASSPTDRRVFDQDMSVPDCDLLVRVDPRGGPFLRSADPPRQLVPTFDGIEGEAALWNALLDGRAPVLGVFDSATGLTTTLALPALEAPHRLLESAEAVLTHLVAGLERTMAAIAAGRTIPQFATSPAPLAPSPPSSAASTSTSALPALARRIGNKASAKRHALLKRAPTWQVAWRRTPTRTLTGDVFDTRQFQRLADDGQRFFADPFVFFHEGVTHVFVEELPYATGKGVISHFMIGADGQPSATRVVLEQAHHLSYPHVFQHDGQIWMIPESSAAGRLDLYRARRFPDRWEHHATLLDAPVHDVTFHAAPDRLWLFAGSTLPGAATWDTLSLYWADRLGGPWQAHPMNPVLVDARSARPAGALFMHEGHLWRPAQDCTRGYGGALTLNRITRLDREGFAQDLVTTLTAGAPGAAQGPHTVNFAGGIEIIDLFQPRGTT